MSAAGVASDFPRVEEIDALLYDFGGVLVKIDFDWIFQRWAELAYVPFEQVKSRFAHGGAYRRHERGEIDLPAYYRELRKELGVELTDEEFTDGWQRVFGPAYPQVVEAVRRIAPRMPQYLLSNTNRTHYDFFRSRYAAALAPLRRLFVSCEMDARKPERAAFEYVSHEIGIPLGRIFFLDDTADNVAGARAAGMKAAHIESPGDVMRAVAPWLAP
ncbi:MAG: HAD family phosphatase [Usitatibacter sp.]